MNSYIIVKASQTGGLAPQTDRLGSQMDRLASKMDGLYTDFVKDTGDRRQFTEDGKIDYIKRIKICLSYDTVCPTKKLRVVTWNVAAINNNPFEYWASISGEIGEQYDALMKEVENTLDSGMGDPISTFLNDKMFKELFKEMLKENADWFDENAQIALEKEWARYKPMSAKAFLQDKDLGAKRLISFPDRFTNTINTNNGPVCRPTAVNGYNEELPSYHENMKNWFDVWITFLFVTKNHRPNGTNGKMIVDRPVDMIKPILKEKYKDDDAIRQDEEYFSKAHQILCLAIYDCLVISLLNKASSKAQLDWQDVRDVLADATIRQKNTKTIQIIQKLSSIQAPMDIICLQEMSSLMIDECKNSFGKEWHVLVPKSKNNDLDQNSVILTHKGSFEHEGKEVSVSSKNKPGDLCLFETLHVSGVTYLVGSFHGATTGSDTVTTVTAVVKEMRPGVRLVFGLDANTHQSHNQEDMNTNLQLHTFLDTIKELGLNSCYGPSFDVNENITTNNSRTVLQTQLNKVVSLRDKDDPTVKGVDKNLKDFVLTTKDLAVLGHEIDSSGVGLFQGCQTVIPTLTFPSDHCILKAIYLA